MPQIPDDAVSQLGDLPVVVAVLLIAMAAVVGIVWIGSKLLQQRDGVFLKFFGEQRDLDRALGKQTAEMNSGALGQLADAVRDNGTATLAMIQTMSDKVDDALNATTNAIRESNHALARLTRELEIQLKLKESGEDADKVG